MKYDLHIHSNISDGALSRMEIIDIAHKKQLSVVSFSEHNKFSPLTKEEEQQLLDIKTINSIEFDVKHLKSFHLLCYFPQITKEIEYLFELYENNTNERTEMLIKKMNQLNHFKLSMDYLKNYFNKNIITKRDIIDWLLDKKIVETVMEAAYKYTSSPAPSYVPKYSLPLKEVVQIIKASKGYTILAHPNMLKLSDYELEFFFKNLVFMGVDGIEVFNTNKMTPEESAMILSITNKLKVLQSSGSDFHDFARGDQIGVEDDFSHDLIQKLNR